MKKDPICKSISILAFFSFFVIFSNCHKDDPMPVFVDQGNIGPGGGIVKTDDGASIEIPADALTTNKTISITNITEGDTIANNGCRIFELKPDGLNFADSVTITFPYDDTYTDLYSQEENFGVGIMVYEDNKWIRLKTKINTAKKVAVAKTTHFSNYFVYFPGRWSLYYNNNKKSPNRILPVPYYNQGSTNWCAYYSLSMITKYAGYQKHGPYYASLLNETTHDVGFTIFDFPLLNRKLTEIGLSAEIAIPAWANLGDLCGYILKQLNEDNPVWVGYKAINASHAIVVTGHDQTGFYINDPSGAFLKKINPAVMFDKYAMAHITYEQFEDAMLGVLDLINPQLFGSENTIVISQVGKEQFNGPSLNFNEGDDDIKILEDLNNEEDTKGYLTINGKFKPDGYTLSVDLDDEAVSFDGSDYIWIRPKISNSRKENVTALLHVRIDNKDIVGSPQTEFIDGRDCYNRGKPMISQLKNLHKGIHNIEVELVSEDSQISYDTWNFELNIANEYIDNGQPPNLPSSPNPSNLATGVRTATTLTWTCSDPDLGDNITFDVYLGSNENSLDQIISNTTSTSISRSSLNQGVTYFWRVVAKDNHGNSTTGPVWRFTIGTAPLVDFSYSPSPVYAGQTVQFTDRSSSNTTDWEWDFGDGSNTSNFQNPTHRFSNPGTYEVTLTASNIFGWRVASMRITVSTAVAVPVANFIASQTIIPAGGTINFTDQSTNNPTSWSWNFGDGGSSTSRNPSHTYSLPGTYTVTLNATNIAGSDSETKNGYITVSAVVVAPVAAFIGSPINITAGQTVQFADQSTNSPTSWSWNFGDGGTSTERNPSHIYNAAGTYTVRLTTTNSAGSDEEIKSDYIAVTAESSGIIFNPDLTYGSVSDIDGNVYKTIQIGDQVWMAENLRTTKYSDGESIELITEVMDWRGRSTPAYCWYNNDPDSFKYIYGALYNWHTINTGKLCPSGWHVPSLVDWKELDVDSYISGGQYKETGTHHWQGGNSNATNSTGFTGLPSGGRVTSNLPDPGFIQMGFETYWWTSTTYTTYPYNDGNFIYNCRLYSNSDLFQVTFNDKTVGFPVRCIKD